MEALVLEAAQTLNLREIDLPEQLGPRDVRVKLHTVGICGSDVHYYQTGQIGPYVVRQPMVLGHEASGTVVEVGRAVQNLDLGDRVCMEPGIPDPTSRATRLGLYNLDPAVRFWATPPVHGVLRPTVVHPAEFTYKLPDNVSFAEGAMVEPLAVGMHAANKARVKPGDVAVVIGAGPIGLVTTMAALAAGCSRIIVSDLFQPKLDLAAKLGPVSTVRAGKGNDLHERVLELTDGWGADLVFECSGSARAAAEVFDLICPGGAVIYIGMPGEPVCYDVVAAQVREARVEHVFRYANVFRRALDLMGSRRIDVRPMITRTFGFDRAVEAFEFATQMPPDAVKVQIELPQ